MKSGRCPNKTAPFNTDISTSSGIIIRLPGNAAWTASCIRGHSENPPTSKIVDRSFVDLLERVFFIKVMMLSIVGVKSLIIKSALNLNLSLHRVILSTYDDESMADCKLFPPKSLHFPSIATNGIVKLTFVLFSVLTVRFTASNSRTRSK